MDWTDKELLVMAVYEDYGAVAASTTATAFHVCLDYHRALNRLHEQVGYDPKLRAQIERFGMTRAVTLVPPIQVAHEPYDPDDIAARIL